MEIDSLVAGDGEQERELERLRARVAELERAHDDLARREAEASRRAALLQKIMDTLPGAVFIKDRESRFIGCSSRFVEAAGLSSPEDMLGKSDYDFSWRDRAEEYRADDRAVMESGEPKLHILEPLLRADGNRIWLETSKMPLRDDEGAVVGLVGVFEDVSDRVRAEEQRRAEREALIASQQELVAELSTPLLPIQDGVLVMPLIGRMDEARCRLILERLLEGVVRHRAGCVILDLTGVPAVDERVAGGVLDAARAAELLGARVLLTGLGPRLARTIVELGLDLGRVATRATLQDGVAEAASLRRIGRGPTPRMAPMSG